MERVFDHGGITADHKARVRFGELESRVYFEAAVFQQFGNALAAQRAFGFLARGDGDEAEFVEMFANQRMVFQRFNTSSENQFAGERNRVRQNQAVETLPDFGLLNDGEERRDARTGGEHDQVLTVGKTFGQEEARSGFVEQYDVALFHRGKTCGHGTAFD